MYVVTQSRTLRPSVEAYERDGELSAAVELRRRFPGIIDNTTAREQARRIAAWTPLPDRRERVRKGKVDGFRGLPALTRRGLADGGLQGSAHPEAE